MNEVAETLVAGAPASVPAAPAMVAAEPRTPGQRLKAARERRGLSSGKAADQMHLDLWVIEALENDEFDKIGPSVYAKGHLKHYAAMLGLPAAEIMAEYGTPPAPAASQRTAMRMRAQEPVGIELPLRTIAVAAVAAVAAVVIVGLVWLRPWRSRSVAPPPVTIDQAPAPAVAVAAMPTPDAGEDDEPATVAPAAIMSTVTAEPKTAVAPRAAAASAPALALPGSGRARLRLSFSADSRVEVRDANGGPVFVGNGRANSVNTIAGDAPLRVYLGFASGVQLAINGHVVAIGQQFVAGDVARFEVGADGVLRRPRG